MRLSFKAHLICCAAYIALGYVVLGWNVWLILARSGPDLTSYATPLRLAVALITMGLAIYHGVMALMLAQILFSPGPRPRKTPPLRRGFA